LKLNGLHGVISQKMILFITTVVKTSNPAPGKAFGFLKMVGIFCVAEQLLASQEGLSPWNELVN
jgi:hypothetical protein